MKCVRIGFGKIARIHEKALARLGVETLGVFDPDTQLSAEITHAGFQYLPSLAAAIALEPDFYDICTPTHAHAQTLSAISMLDASANVLIEKPICDFHDIDLVKDVLARHTGQIVVNENYASSVITDTVNAQLTRLNLTPTKIIVEMTKHRGQDYLQGRFIDKELGAVGYEGSHLVALAGEIGSEYLMTDRVIETDIDSIHLHPTAVISTCANDSKSPTTTSLLHQGGAYTHFIAKNGCAVELYTSMAGIIGYPCPPYAHTGQRIAEDDQLTRYRILRVDAKDTAGTSYQIIGFYEPLSGLPRRQGAVLIFREWILEQHISPIPDDTMEQHLRRVITCFSGQGRNPYSVQKAIDNVLWLHDWARQGWHDMSDSDCALGSDATIGKRIAESAKFKLG